MNKKYIRYNAIIALVFLLSTTGYSKTYIIQFGGAIGSNYSPTSLQVEVGDTLDWQGNFSFHPLLSTSVPAGAADFSKSTGSDFTYVVTAAGDYNYKCTVHAGMVGSFTAVSVTSVKEYMSNVPTEFNLEQNYPNPFNPATTIKYSIPTGVETRRGESLQHVTLKIYDVLGNEVATLVSETKEPGIYQVEFNATKFRLTSGMYFYELHAGDFRMVKKLMLMK